MNLENRIIEKGWAKTEDNQFLAIFRIREGNWAGRINPSADDILTGSPSSFCAKDVYYEEGFPSAQVASAYVVKMYIARGSK